jgi:phenylpropionate dioxygenase-like ring-hydroxylating dioxygenase large terminal subunit
MTLDLETRKAGNTYPKSTLAENPVARGDAITGDRYYSQAFANREWEHMWKRVWHVAGRTAELEDAGDFIVHNFLHESVMLVKQEDGSIKAFFNVCRHRGNRLVSTTSGGVSSSFSCPYHGWKWGIDGVLKDVQDPDDFPQGNPCGKLTLKELPCDTWGGFIWYSFDQNVKPLLEYLDPIPDLLAGRDLDSWHRVTWRTLSVNTNWKFASDNFNESYHLPTVHPQMQAIIDEDYQNTIFEMFPSGHNRMIEMGQPSMRAMHPNEVEPLWEDMLKEWDIDPAAFKGRARDARIALQQAKRKLGPERGYTYFNTLSDDELTDHFHHTLFPNVTITGTADGLHFFRTQPVSGEPGKCTFDYWYMVPKIEGRTEAPTIYGMRPYAEAEHEDTDFTSHKAELGIGDFLVQDLSIAETQQMGLSSMGYGDAYLSGQEVRVRRFHEVLNDYLDGTR